MALKVPGSFDFAAFAHDPATYICCSMVFLLIFWEQNKWLIRFIHGVNDVRQQSGSGWRFGT